MTRYDDYRHAAFTRAYGTVGRAATLDCQSAIAALVPLQEWEWPESHRPDLAAIRDRAAEARHGGGVYRRALATHGVIGRKVDAYAPREALRLSGGTHRWTWDHLSPITQPVLTEAAFDWPIYRAATGRTVAELTCVCGHAFAAHQSGEGAWTGFCGAPMLDDGGEPYESCQCEAPVTPERQAAQIASIRERMA